MTTWTARLVIMIIICAAIYVIPEQINRLAEVSRLRGGKAHTRRPALRRVAARLAHVVTAPSAPVPIVFVAGPGNRWWWALSTQHAHA